MVAEAPQVSSNIKPGYNGQHRLKDGAPSSLGQVILLQNILIDNTKDLREDMRKCKDKDQRARIAVAIARSTQSWDGLEDRKRILKGKGLPASERAPREHKSRGKGAEVVAKEAAKTEVKPAASPAVQPTVLPKPEAQEAAGDSKGVSADPDKQKQAI